MVDTPNTITAIAYMTLGIAVLTSPTAWAIQQRFWKITLYLFGLFIVACGIHHAGAMATWWTWPLATISTATLIYVLWPSTRKQFKQFFILNRLNNKILSSPSTEPLQIFEVAGNDLRLLQASHAALQQAPIKIGQLLGEVLPSHTIRQGYQAEPLLSLYRRTAITGESFRGDISYEGEGVTGIYAIACEQISPGQVLIRWQNVTDQRSGYGQRIKSFEAVQAFSQGKMKLWGQPIYELHTMRGDDPTIAAYEGLIRWPQEDGTVKGPNDFLPLLDNAQLAPQVFYFTVAEALKVLQRRDDILKLSVNLSPVVLDHEDFPDEMFRLLHGSQVQAERLGIEVTEDAVLNAPVGIPKLQQVRDRRQSISIDDAPAGKSYKQLSQLARIAHFIKIDRSYVDGVSSDYTQQEILISILALANAFGLKAIAEGIENDADLQWLIDAGCWGGQGYGLGRPAPFS